MGKLLKQIMGFAFALLGSIAFAQTTQVSGTVSDMQGPLPGVNIVVKGTTNGVTSDFDGNYTISDLSADAVLVFSYIGFSTQEITVSNRSTIDVELSEDSALLDEVVVVGYGTQSRREVTGAIASIKAEDIAQVVTGNPTAALQGKLAGVQVETFGGQPGGSANVFVRGIGSLTNSSPLYVIDGTFAENMDFVNPNDIESIQVLKDASSAAIYGSRASNGVVLITTKKGIRDEISVNLNIRGGFEVASKKLDFLNSEQFLDYRRDFETNDASGFQIDPANFSENGSLTYTDWQDKSLGTGPIQDYGVSVAGGNEKSRFFFSTNYYNQDGILVGSGFERINARVNSDFNIGKFTITESIGLTQSKIQENEYFGFEAATSPILRFNAPENEGGFEAPVRETSGFGGINNYALATLDDNLETRRNLLGNVSVAYEIVDGLTAKLNLGLDYTNSFRETFRPTYFMSPTDARFNDNPQNDLTHVRSEFLKTQIEPTLNYNKEFGNHKVDVVVGYGQLRTRYDLLANYVGNLPSNDIRTTGAAGVDNIIGSAGFKEVDGLISTFGRLNYSFAGKYLFTGTIRRDKSSKFAEGFRSDVFPSFSLGWRISDEEFFPQDGIISEAKLRGGYGELGAQNVGNYLYQSVVGTTSSASFGNSIAPGFAQTSFANDGLQWETSSTVNFGIDLGLFNNALTFSAEYYKKDIENLLVAVPIPSSNGTNVPLTQNAGGLENSGIEFLLNYKKTEGDFKFDIGINLATQKSTLTQVPSEFFGPSVNEGIQSVNIFRAGEDPGSFYGFVVDGVYDDQAQIDSDPNRSNDPNISALSPGDFIKKDINGDGQINNEDQTILGSPVPDFTYGINLNGEYKNFDFSIFINGVQGNEIYNQARVFNTLSADGNKFTDVLDRWSPQNTTGSLPRPTSTDPGQNGLPSSYAVEDGSFIRLQNLTVGYDFSEYIKTEWIKRFRLSVTGQNLFVVTNYSGYDPDVASTNGARSNENDGFFGFRPTVNSVTGRGIDIRAYPRPTGIIFGLEVGF
ncbi:SusC/RagA family TonB-linked outer membrane protein [Zobellia nedashkovskayae]|uniref:SusC/RagA family TonB-linked outer membrane protein n=1 Tax=Zobellia nedashkovskayae TaxID=2779510 RepID=UPI001D048FE5|nr:TonB-dependent receptor [Zobellia nedashkovskayae]